MDTLLRQNKTTDYVVIWDGTNRTPLGKQLAIPSETWKPAPVIAHPPTLRSAYETQRKRA